MIAFSSGNHAQAIARAGQILGVPTTIVMPQDAPAAKLAATRGYGGEVVTFDRYTQDREAIGKRIATERGADTDSAVQSSRGHRGPGHRDEGTDRGSRLRSICSSSALRGGGLTSGSALAAHALSKGIRVIGVEPEAGNDAQQSFRKGEIITIPVPKTLADGAQTTALGADHLRADPSRRGRLSSPSAMTS